MLDFLLVFSLPKLVFDDEICGQTLHFLREIRRSRRPADSGRSSSSCSPTST